MKFDDEFRPVFNSVLAVKVLRIIGTSHGGDYGSSIAQTLGKSQASISRILGELHDLEFIAKGKREKAQYYRNDYESIGDFWYRFIYNEISESEKVVHRKKWMVDEYTDKEEILEGFDQNEEEIKETVSRYSKLVFEGNSPLKELTVSKILFQQFGLSIEHNVINTQNFLDENPYLIYPMDALIHLFKMEGFSRELHIAAKEEPREDIVTVVKK